MKSFIEVINQNFRMCSITCICLFNDITFF